MFLLPDGWAVRLGCLHLLFCHALARAHHLSVPPAACVDVMLLSLYRAAATQPDPPQPWLLPAHPLQLCSVSLVAFFSSNRPFKDLEAQDPPVRISLQLRLHHSQELPLVLVCPCATHRGSESPCGHPSLITPALLEARRARETKGRCCLLLSYRELCLSLLGTSLARQ